MFGPPFLPSATERYLGVGFRCFDDPGLLANRSEGRAVEPGATTKSKPPGAKMSLTGR